jgi:hypothetical protein
VSTTLDHAREQAVGAARKLAAEYRAIGNLIDRHAADAEASPEQAHWNVMQALNEAIYTRQRSEIETLARAISDLAYREAKEDGQP